MDLTMWDLEAASTQQGLSILGRTAVLLISETWGLGLRALGFLLRAQDYKIADSSSPKAPKAQKPARPKTLKPQSPETPDFPNFITLQPPKSLTLGLGFRELQHHHHHAEPVKALKPQRGDGLQHLRRVSLYRGGRLTRLSAHVRTHQC